MAVSQIYCAKREPCPFTQATVYVLGSQWIEKKPYNEKLSMAAPSEPG